MTHDGFIGRHLRGFCGQTLSVVPASETELVGRHFGHVLGEQDRFSQTKKAIFHKLQCMSLVALGLYSTRITKSLQSITVKEYESPRRTGPEEQAKLSDRIVALGL